MSFLVCLILNLLLHENIYLHNQMSLGNRRLSRITLKWFSAFKDTDFILATRVPHENTHMKILFCSAGSTLATKKIMFQCQVYKQHQCSIMLKEIIPTRGCSSLLNKSFSRICVLMFLFWVHYVLFCSVLQEA